MEGLLQKQSSLGINVRGRFMGHVLHEIIFFTMHFSRLYGYVTYGIIATGFNPVAFWEHLVPLNYGKLCSNHNVLCWNVVHM